MLVAPKQVAEELLLGLLELLLQLAVYNFVEAKEAENYN